MSLQEYKNLIQQAEPLLLNEKFVIIKDFIRNNRKLSLAITARLQQKCKKGRVWKNKALLTALKNAEYGFDPNHPHSPGGNDGIFILTREHKKTNQMMNKIFNKFLDNPKEQGFISDIAKRLETSEKELIAVRLVSHHMRLLGLLHCSDKGDILVLVDFDDTK